MKVVKLTAIFAISMAAAMTASAQLTFSGLALNNLTYVGNPGDAQYVPASGPIPDLAVLSTPDSGTSESADSPAVFVQGPLGPLSSFSGSFDLYSSSGPSGTVPYWNIQVSPAADPSVVVEIISMGGTPLTQSSTMHAYGTDWSGLPDNGYWGDTLTQLDAITYDGYTIGDMTVEWAGVEIGDWDNGTNTIPAAASFDSITVVPEPGTVTLVGMGLMSMLLVVRRRRA